ncbi:hypothetical protein [Haloferula sp. A504]|uniref:hypothetical protein n=1 Tax=Haloferula sp. A504 TaxID=3373601 RepID=UPI0031BED578|nr:hypothetical protein [Verrucomicrobiaceae bacterium E54]
MKPVMKRPMRAVLRSMICLSIVGVGLASEEEDARIAAIQKNLGTFKKIELKTDPGSGRPIPFQIELNKDVIVHDGLRLSGFRFTVDRDEKFGPKRDQHFAWYFIVPANAGFKSWYVVKSEGKMRGFHAFRERDPGAFRGLDKVPPKDKGMLILQLLGGSRFVDGDEYVMWFGFDEASVEPRETTVCLGFTPDDDTNSFLGLEPIDEEP